MILAYYTTFILWIIIFKHLLLFIFKLQWIFKYIPIEKMLFAVILEYLSVLLVSYFFYKVFDK